VAEKFFLRLVYGGLPPASFDEGIRQLQRATELEPGELNHWLELGFAYAAAGRMEEARQQWTHGLAMPSHAKPDEPAKARTRAALSEQH
jgi:cytochrome c-type biogenesis protein CcmH/NrfG